MFSFFPVSTSHIPVMSLTRTVPVSKIDWPVTFFCRLWRCGRTSRGRSIRWSNHWVSPVCIQRFPYPFRNWLFCKFETCSPITEYGKVVQSRATSLAMPEFLQRWIRTLHFNTVDIDGNPNHALNGGILGLANSHAVGSLLNHSRSHAKCSYLQKDLISPDLKSVDGTMQIGCIFIRADRKIYRHEHLLINYEPNTAALIQNMLHFVWHMKLLAARLFARNLRCKTRSCENE